ncbi:peptidoglycan DD-metalloendopeptidase family protein [Planctomycetota bacterium]|nr:peptidoglycan DD-metalloendopeptidase family protein [Planctomycetota bacterium]
MSRYIVAIALLLPASQAFAQSSLHRHYSNAARTHHYNTVRAAPNGTYTWEGQQCFVEDQSFAGGTPLFEMYHPSLVTYAYAAGFSQRTALENAGYGYVARRGYLAASASAAPGLVTVYQVRDPVTNDHLITTSLTEYQAVKSSGFVRPIGQSSDVLGYAWTVRWTAAPPASVASGGSYQVGLAFVGGQASHVNLHWSQGATSNPLAQPTGYSSPRSGTGSGVAPYADTVQVQAPLVTVDTVFRYAFHVRLGNRDYASVVRTVRVIAAAPQPPTAPGPPVVTPAGGTHNAPVQVTISVDSGALARYTLDGSTPDQGSPVYAGPLLIGANTTLSTRAFGPGGASSTRTAQFTFATPSSPATNPSADEILQELERLSLAHGVPRDLMAAVLHEESAWEQFWTHPGSQNYTSIGRSYLYSTGDPKRGYDHDSAGRLISVGIGLTQVTLAARNRDPNQLDPNHGAIGTVDVQRLESDWQYNLEQGFLVMLKKWEASNSANGFHGDDDRNLLESWYYPAIYYNGAPAYFERLRAILLTTPGSLSGRVTPTTWTRPTDVDATFQHGQPFTLRLFPGQNQAEWLFNGRHALGAVSRANLATIQETQLALDDQGTAQFGWPFNDIGFTESHGSQWHAGDDEYAQDWVRSSGLGTIQGAAVRSVTGGLVVFSGTIPDANGISRPAAEVAFGNQVIVQVSGDHFLRYAHLATVGVGVGESVALGDPIGTVGDTGLYVTGPHLHLALYKDVGDSTALEAGGTAGRIAVGIAATDEAARFALVPRITDHPTTGGAGVSQPNTPNPAATSPPAPVGATVPSQTSAPAPGLPPTTGGGGGSGGGCAIEGPRQPTPIALLLLLGLLSAGLWRARP